MQHRLFLGVGFGVWLAATLVFRIAGHEFFKYEDLAVMIVIYIATVVGILAVAFGLFRWQNLTQQQQIPAAVLLALPGMFLDVVSIEFFEDIFPNMETMADGPFGAWLLWAYALVLLSAFIPNKSVE